MSKYRSPTSNEVVGADDATLYLSAKLFTPATLLATVVTFAEFDAKVFNPLIPARVFMSDTVCVVPKVFISDTASAVPNLPISVALDATVVTSVALGTNL